MNEAEEVFRETERERKRNGRGTYNKKRQGGRHVHLPSDNLTKKEREKMNGEVTVYKLNEFVPYEEFKNYPATIKKEWFQNITTKYGCSTVEMAKEMGTSQNTISRAMRELGIGTGRDNWHGKTEEQKKEWAKYLISKEAPKEKPTEKPNEKHDAVNIEDIISALKGTGAKLTIEITL